MAKVRHVLGISGGKDSAALAIYLKNLYPLMDIEYYSSDTGKELDETYQLISNLEVYLGKSINILRAAENSHEDPFDHFLKMYGGFLPSSNSRWCTKKLKLEPFEKYVANDLVVSYVGIRGDEDREGYISRKSNIQSIFPFRRNIWSEDVIEKFLANSKIEQVIELLGMLDLGRERSKVENILVKPLGLGFNMHHKLNQLLDHSVKEANHLIYELGPGIGREAQEAHTPGDPECRGQLPERGGSAAFAQDDEVQPVAGAAGGEGAQQQVLALLRLQPARGDDEGAAAVQVQRRPGARLDPGQVDRIGRDVDPRRREPEVPPQAFGHVGRVGQHPVRRPVAAAEQRLDPAAAERAGQLVVDDRQRVVALPRQPAGPLRAQQPHGRPGGQAQPLQEAHRHVRPGAAHQGGQGAGRLDRPRQQPVGAVEGGVALLVAEPPAAFGHVQPPGIDLADVGAGAPQQAHADVEAGGVAAVQQVDGHPLRPAAVQRAQQQQDADAPVRLAPVGPAPVRLEIVRGEASRRGHRGLIGASRPRATRRQGPGRASP